MVLARHNIVLGELVTEPTVLVVTAGYSDAPQPQESCRSSEVLAVHPRAEYWTSARMDDEPGFESWMHLYVSRVSWSSGRLDPILRMVADDVVANVVVTAADLRWLYHPYDGGMDVMLSSMAERDALRDRIRTGCRRTRAVCDTHAKPRALTSPSARICRRVRATTHLLGMTDGGHTAPGPVAEPGYCSAESRRPGTHGRLKGVWGHRRAASHQGFKSPPVRASSSAAVIARQAARQSLNVAAEPVTACADLPMSGCRSRLSPRVAKP
jgi:hypothetical protein